MFGLVMLWLLLGLFVGVVALGARLGMATRTDWLWPMIGVGSAGVGGMAGSVVLGPLYGLPVAGVSAVICVCIGTWLVSRKFR